MSGKNSALATETLDFEVPLTCCKTSRKVLVYGIYARVVDISEIGRVRFLIQNNDVVHTV